MEKKIKYSFLYLFLLHLLICFKGYAQISVTGPVCVTAGTGYQYIITGIGSGAASIQVCITGGHFSGTDSTCRTGGPVSFVRVTWDNSSTGSIAITGQAGNTSINVTKANVLAGGNVDSLSRVQTVHTGLIPLKISCQPVTGGSCTPYYVYQWQESTDGVHWTNIANKVASLLDFSSSLVQTTYYRRKVTDTVSHSEKTSDMAIVMIMP